MGQGLEEPFLFFVGELGEVLRLPPPLPSPAWESWGCPAWRRPCGSLRAWKSDREKLFLKPGERVMVLHWKRVDLGWI